MTEASLEEEGQPAPPNTWWETGDQLVLTPFSFSQQGFWVPSGHTLAGESIHLHFGALGSRFVMHREVQDEGGMRALFPVAPIFRGP